MRLSSLIVLFLPFTFGVKLRQRPEEVEEHDESAQEEERRGSWEPDEKFEPDRQWVSARPPKIPKMPIKLAVMMLAHPGQVNNPAVWTAWLDQAHKEGTPINFFIHSKHGREKWTSKQKVFSQYVLGANQTQRTSWGYLVAAEQKLLEYGLEDENVTHFVLVSSDSVPVKPVSWIYGELSSNPDSRMCVADNKVPPRAEMWWVLSRRDAVLFNDNKERINGGDQIAGDEKVWYLPLLRRLQRWGGRRAGFASQCVMFTDWQTGLPTPHTWGEHLGQCNCPGLLAEKQRNATASHPNVYDSLGEQSMTELLASPFWFARKFELRAMTREAIKVAKDRFKNFTEDPARLAEPVAGGAYAGIKAVTFSQALPREI